MLQKEIFSERLANLRKQHNLSQQQLADVIGLSYHAIGKMENKQRLASVEVLYALADYFNVSLDYLAGRISNPDSHIKEENRL